ncbi:TSPc domain-containing protein [Tenacibaculum sp. 190130A14a]|uniref:TSPc domain-containing protein n=1 Tax=Tenacibaculum polynesiense TaxID=3137857 RepID=A0ABM9PFI8_9FLAO
MRKFILLLLVAVIGTSCVKNNSSQLSEEEKKYDFEYLYKELKESYPYFYINKRLNNVDWLANKNDYLKRISETRNDKEFFIAINEILGDLNNDHTDTYPTIIYDYFYKGYKGALAEYGMYKSYVEELEKTDTVKTKYWSSIKEQLQEVKHTKIAESQEKNLDGIETQNLMIDLKKEDYVAILRIKSFSYDLVAEDSKRLKTFFQNDLKNYANLIIDIQGNEGGDTTYWMDHIVSYLIKDSLNYTVNYGFKNSERIRKFKPSYFKKKYNYKDLDLENLPQELKTNEYLIYSTEQSIAPKSTQKYQGNIYLLVDGLVYSSAEALAHFFKTTKIGKVVGERTNGDGVGTDPLLLTLPNSGIVVRFTGEMGLNPDGSANEEAKTTPDISIEAVSSDERLHNLLIQITEN